MNASITEKTTISLGFLAVLVGWTGAIWAWADGEHEDEAAARAAALEEAKGERTELREIVAELKTSNALIEQLTVQTSALVQELADDAAESRDTLIRIETKLESRDNGG